MLLGLFFACFIILLACGSSAGGPDVEKPASSSSNKPLLVFERTAASNCSWVKVRSKLAQQALTFAKKGERLAREFGFVRSKELTLAWYERAPTILFLGPFSSGKTTLIREMLKLDPSVRLPEAGLLEVSNDAKTARWCLIQHQHSAAGGGGGRQEYETVPAKAMGAMDQHNADLSECWKSQRDASGEASCHFVRFASRVLASGITVVDSPGLQPMRSVDGQYNDDVEFFLQRADKIVFVLDVLKSDKIANTTLLFERAWQCCQSRVKVLVNKADALLSVEALLENAFKLGAAFGPYLKGGGARSAAEASTAETSFAYVISDATHVRPETQALHGKLVSKTKAVLEELLETAEPVRVRRVVEDAHKCVRDLIVHLWLVRHVKRMNASDWATVAVAVAMALIVAATAIMYWHVPLVRKVLVVLFVVVAAMLVFRVLELQRKQQNSFLQTQDSLFDLDYVDQSISGSEDVDAVFPNRHLRRQSIFRVLQEPFWQQKDVVALVLRFPAVGDSGLQKLVKELVGSSLEQEWSQCMSSDTAFAVHDNSPEANRKPESYSAIESSTWRDLTFILSLVLIVLFFLRHLGLV